MGDEVETADGESVRVTGVEKEHLEEPVTVYNFEVADWHTYYVSGLGVLVHNKCYVEFGVGKGGTVSIKSTDLIFGSNTKSTQKIMNQMNSRGWTETLMKDTVGNPYTIRVSTNKATGNSATVFYTKQGSYVIVDDVTKEIVQISDNINPSTWIPDTNIVNPYKPK